ncbi:MAG: hypothetical protein AVDCRST_MAG22-1237, partial [uncultured Rubrobacteraceae bacterium]
ARKGRHPGGGGNILSQISTRMARRLQGVRGDARPRRL